MRKATKTWLIIASSLVLIGGIIMGSIMSILKWDFTKLTTDKYQTNSYELTENFKNISVVTDTADILFVPCEEQKASVICYEQKNLKHSVTVNADTLVIAVVDTRSWYEHIGITFQTPKITIYIPQGKYGTLSVISSTGDVVIPKEFEFQGVDIGEDTGNVTNYASASENIIIKTGTGDIHLENVSANTLDLSVSTGGVTVSDVTCEGDLKIKVSTGKTNLTNVECKNIISTGDTGNISLKNAFASENFSIKRSTGHIRFDRSDAGEIIIETDTGDVKGTLLTDKVFITQTDTGKVNVPKTVTGGKCEITTSTGDIVISVPR